MAGVALGFRGARGCSLGGVGAARAARRSAVGEDDDARVVAEHLSSLLSGWHAWASTHRYCVGYPSVNPNCRSARISRQYDDENGELDAHVDSVLMEAVDAVVDSIADPWRTALAVQARNLCTGAAVWSSPRLPRCEQARRVLVVEAREKFRVALALRNLI